MFAAALDGPAHHFGADAPVAVALGDMHDLDLAALHAAPHQAGQIAQLEAADGFPVLLDDDHLLIGIGSDLGEGIDVVRMRSVGGVVAGLDDAVFDDERNDERQVFRCGGAVGEGHGSTA